MTQVQTWDEWAQTIETELARFEGRLPDRPALDDATRSRIVQEVEATLRKAHEAGAGLDERSFLRGATAALAAVYGESVDGFFDE